MTAKKDQLEQPKDPDRNDPPEPETGIAPQIIEGDKPDGNEEETAPAKTQEQNV